MNKRAREELRLEFDRSGLTDWHIIEGSNTFRGGQASVLEVQRSDGLLGVFRLVRLQSQADRQRFLQEVDLLREDRFQHPNIVHILDHSNDLDHLWYVTELGQQFDEYWTKRRTKLENEPLAVVSEAVQVIDKLLSGLAPLHIEGVVHRDIKPDNIIILDKETAPRPVLIDFGVVYRQDAPRITDLSDAVGNRAFSPDVMMNRMTEVPPWLDIFELAQVLIWMTCEKPAKTWARPLHWRWVNYDPRLPNEVTLSLRAVTALCSERSVSPPDALAMKELLARFFEERFSDGYETRPEEFKAIREAILASEAEKELNMAEDETLITACLPAFELAYAELRNAMNGLATEISHNGINVQVTIDQEVSKPLQWIRRNKGDGHYSLYNVVFSAGERKRGFGVNLSLGAYRPSRRSIRGRDWPPDTENLLVLAFRVTDGGVKSVTNYSALITLSNSGEFRLWNSEFEDMGLVSTEHFVSLVRAIVLDPSRWATLARY